MNNCRNLVLFQAFFYHYYFGGLDDNTEVDTVDSEAERFRCFKEPACCTLLLLILLDDDGKITIDVPFDLKMTSGPPP